MNHSIYSADRSTHLKIVTLALVAATAVAGIGIAAHVGDGDRLVRADQIHVVKAGKPVVVTATGQFIVR